MSISADEYATVVDRPLAARLRERGFVKQSPLSFAAKNGKSEWALRFGAAYWALQDWALDMAEMARSGGRDGACASGALMLFDREGLANVSDDDIRAHVRHWLADHAADGVGHCDRAMASANGW